MVIDPFEHPPDEPWSKYDALRGLDAQLNWIYRRGFLGLHGQWYTPSIPCVRVRDVISAFERGTASRKAYDWLNRTEVDDDMVIDAIVEVP